MCLIEDERIVIMRVGSHGVETLPQIVVRKQAEARMPREKFKNCCLWGYGGLTAKPEMVRGLAEKGPVKVVFIKTKSRFKSDGQRAEQYWEKRDGNPIPFHESVNVTGSKYALVLKNFQEVATGLAVNLSAYDALKVDGTVKPLNLFLKNQTDKACARRSTLTDIRTPQLEPVFAIAELAAPFAVFISEP